jgi:hypothetical protein
MKAIGAGIAITVCFFYLGCASVQMANASKSASSSTPLTFATRIVPSAVAGTPYVLVLDAAGGTPGYTWSIAAGQLPAGVTLSPATGVISGTPTASGNFSIAVTLTDAASPQETRTSTVTISVAAPPRLVQQLLASRGTSSGSPTQGVPYTQTLQGTGGNPAYSWQITAGTLPSGLALDSTTGIISGTPLSSGLANFSVTVSDTSRPILTNSLPVTLNVAPAPLAIVTKTLSAVSVNSPYLQTLQATGGTPGYRWSIAIGALPAGLSLSPLTGAISGRPTASGSSTFTIAVTDSSSPAQGKSTPMTLIVTAPALAIVPSTLPSVTVGSGYSQTLQAVGGTGSYTWSVTSGAVPSGLTLSPSGILSGTPAVSGSATFTATVTDAGSPAQVASVIKTLSVTPLPLSVKVPVLPAVRAGTPYSQTFQVSGGTAPYKWSVTAGTLPGGVALATAGTLAGTPSGSGTSTFTATVTDSSSPALSASVSASVAVKPSPLVITSSAMPSVSAGSGYSQDLHANGGTGPYTWSVSAGSLPTGITLTPATGTLSGMPRLGGTAKFTISVADHSSPSQVTSAPTSIVVATPAIAIATTSLPTYVPGKTYSQTLQATGGSGSYTWSVASGALPSGLSLSTSGVISGTTVASGVSTVSVMASDNNAAVQAISAPLSVAPATAPLAILSSSLSTATNGAAYSQTLSATGGTPGYTWQLTSGSLPAGLTLTSAGSISGTPASTGTSAFTVSVIDNGSPSQTQSASLSLNVSAGKPAGAPNTWYVSAAGGTRYSVNVPSGLCDGTSPASPVGTSPNQHCAFNDIRYLWTDASYTSSPSDGAPKWGWIGNSGDTYLVDCSGMPNSSCRIGQSGPNVDDSFGLHGSPTSSGAPTPISGTAGAHTKIYGVNYAACSATNRTRLNGGYGVDTVLNMYGAVYVDVNCFDITDFSSCGQSGQRNNCNGAYPFSDYASNGIMWHKESTYDTVTNVSIHGMSKAGMHGAPGTGVVLNNISLIGNASSGWNADLGDGTTGTGTLLVQNFDISWNGCAEEYPIVDALPYQDCTDDNHGGYGDGFGTASTPSSPGWNVTFDTGVASNNTQDGLDALHLTGAGSSMTITRTLAYGNMGQQLKNGGNSGSILNSVIIGNCNALRSAIPGTPTGYNSRLSDFCRAADEGILLSVQAGSTTRFDGNTVYAANVSGIYVVSGGTYDSTASIDFRDNIFLGFVNNPTTGYVNGGSGYYSTPLDLDPSVPGLMTNPGTQYSHNATFPTTPTSRWSCPQTGESNAVCSNSGLVDQTWHIYGYGNVAPSPSSSAVIGAGVSIPVLATDYTGFVRTVTPSIGAYE